MEFSHASEAPLFSLRLIALPPCRQALLRAKGGGGLHEPSPRVQLPALGFLLRPVVIIHGQHELFT